MMKVFHTNQEELDKLRYNLFLESVLTIHSHLAIVGHQLGFYTMLATISESWEKHVQDVLDYRMGK